MHSIHQTVAVGGLDCDPNDNHLWDTLVWPLSVWTDIDRRHSTVISAGIYQKSSHSLKAGWWIWYIMEGYVTLTSSYLKRISVFWSPWPTNQFKMQCVTQINSQSWFSWKSANLQCLQASRPTQWREVWHKWWCSEA